MTPTLRKLYHRRGKLLSYLNEIDRQINELTPQKGDLVVYDDGVEFHIGIYTGYNTIYSGKWTFHFWAYSDTTFNEITTILEKGFDK